MEEIGSRRKVKRVKTMEQKVRSKKMFLTRGEIRGGDLEGKGISGEMESGLERGGSDRLFRLVWFISEVLFTQPLSLSP